MTCRAPTSTTTCAGSTPNGAQLSYDNEGRFSSWQDTLGGTSDQFLYDGEGQRVAQQITSGGITTTATYVGQVEELRITSGTTTTTTYYYAGGKRVALAVNGTFSYLGNDGQCKCGAGQHGQRAGECALRAVWGGALWSREGILIAQSRRIAVMPPLP